MTAIRSLAAIASIVVLTSPAGVGQEAAVTVRVDLNRRLGTVTPMRR